MGGTFDRPVGLLLVAAVGWYVYLLDFKSRATRHWRAVTLYRFHPIDKYPIP